MRFLPRFGTLLSTACIALAFAPVEWPALIWIGFVPWLFVLERSRTLPDALAQGMWLNVLLGFAGAFWVAYAATRYLELSFLGGVLALCVHALFHQVQLVIFAGLFWCVARSATRSSIVTLAACPLLYTGIDWATPKLFQDTFGIAIHGSASLRQLVALGGPPLLTFVVMTVNLGLYAAIAQLLSLRSSKDANGRRVLLPISWVVLTILVSQGIGSFERAKVDQALTSPTKVLKVGIVQGNVDDDLKRQWAAGDPEAAHRSLAVYVRATKELVESHENLHMVVWPETTFPGIFRKPESDPQLQLNVAFDRFIANEGVPLVFGAYDRDDESDQRVLRNGLYLVAPEPGQAAGELSPMQVYHKSILFPFAEYIPLLDEETAKRWFPRASHFSNGEGVVTMEVQADGESVRLGPSICYEDLFSNHAATLARAGADVIVNVSNDSWFGDYGAARLHLATARLRSIETRLPQVRATNSGYSALILPNGEIRGQTEFGVQEATTFEVPILRLEPTLRVELGDWFGPFSLVLGLLLALPLARRNSGRR